MDSIDNKPLIVGFVSDLMFAVKIEDVALRLNYRVKWIERADQVATPDPDSPKRQLAEHLVGPGAILLDRLTKWRPALIIFDLNNKDVPWREWISLIASAPATRRIPILCFGSHIDIEATQAARAAGAKIVVARSRFAAALPELIEKHARVIDIDRLSEACGKALSHLAIQGLEEFNRGEYFEAHELLEHAWIEDESDARDLYRAVLQVAVAYLQIQRGNYNGALKMFLRMRQWIDPLPDTCRGIDVAALRSDAGDVYELLLDLGPDRISEFDHSLFKPVRYAV